MYDYRIKFSLENGQVRSKIFSGESEGEAIENYDYWADSQNQFLEFLSIEEIEE